MGHLLSRQNRRVTPILGDGDCFFRAIAEIVYTSQDYHQKVREEIVRHIRSNATRFSHLLMSTLTIEQHTANMQVTGVWATQVEIQAATEVYCASIYLFTLTATRDSYTWHRYEPKTASTTQHFEIAHSSGIHFEVVLDATTNRASPY